MNVVQKILNLKQNKVEHFVLTNRHGMSVELISWGATLVDVRVPDKHGVVESVTLAYEDMADYIDNPSFLGCVVGRVAGRIANGRFDLNGQSHNVQCNAGAHQLHGGRGAMWQQNWRVHHVSETRVAFEYISVAGENGYPAALCVTVTYMLTDDNTLSIDYRAVADAPTLCNLTNHAYFNLSGNARRDVRTHELQVAAKAVCAMSDELMVTGDEWAVDGAFDFRNAKPLADALDSPDPRIVAAHGLDHYFILDAVQHEQSHVTLADPISGRRLRVMTNQPCVVLYAHNHASGEVLRHQAVGKPFDALCIETQKLPHITGVNGNHPAAIDAEQAYTQRTYFQFDVIK